MGFFKKEKRGLKKAQLEQEAKIKAFLEEYKALSIKHGLDIAAEIEYQRVGIRPVLRVVEIQQPPSQK